MSKQSISTLKSWFRRGLKPLEEQFAHWLDSFWHKDATDIPMASIDGLQDVLNDLATVDAVEALDTAKEDKANKGAANGYASLDGGGKVPSGQLPSFVDDVLEFVNFAAFPVLGETGKIFIALDTNYSYRWGGSVYVQITAAPADASETVKGIAEIATQSETDTGTDDLRFVTPLKLRASIFSGFSIKFRNLANNFTSLLQNAATAVRTYSFPDKSITVAGIIDIQEDTVKYAVASGTTVLTASMTPTVASLVAGQFFRIKLANNITASTTLNIDGTGAKTLKKNGATDLASGDGLAGQIMNVVYDGANYQVVGFYGLNITAAEIAAIPNGAINLFTVTKSIDGLTISYGAGVGTVDNFAVSLDTQLGDTAAWGNVSGQNSDWLDLTGNNLSGGLGQNSQEYIIGSIFYKCVSHTLGTTSSNGTARWVRNKSIDLEINATVIADITSGTGWSGDRKTSTVKAKVGNWYATTSGYFYYCYSDNGVNPTAWYWGRVGTPDAIFVGISDATLIAEIEAHDFTVVPVFTPVASVKGSDRQEHYWTVSGVPNYAKCVDVAGTKFWLKYQVSGDVPGVLKNLTTNNKWVKSVERWATFNGSSGSGTLVNSFTNDSVIDIDLFVQGIKSDGSYAYSGHVKGRFLNDGGVLTQIGSSTEDITETAGTVTYTLSVVGGAIEYAYTTGASGTIKHVQFIEYLITTYS